MTASKILPFARRAGFTIARAPHLAAYPRFAKAFGQAPGPAARLASVDGRALQDNAHATLSPLTSP
jgi:hypothetical protein